MEIQASIRRQRIATYWPRVVWRAVSTSLSFFGGWKISIPAVMFGLGTLVHLNRSGIDAVLQEWSTTLSYGIYPFLMLFAVLVVWNFILTPPRMEIEGRQAMESITANLRNEIEGLKLKIYNREARQLSINKLWELRAEGVGIRNQNITSEEYDDWYLVYEEWEKRVFYEAGQVSENLQKWLMTLDRVRKGVVTKYPAVHVTHKRDKDNLSEVLLRMQEFLEADMLNRDISAIRD